MLCGNGLDLLGSFMRDNSAHGLGDQALGGVGQW
jgi:hypothetical protein